MSAYYADTREVELKLKIYFDGPNVEPLEVQRDDYLIQANILEELSATSEHPIGTITSNELSVTLYNPENIFTPDHVDSPYANKIVPNLMIKVEIREVIGETEWCPMGTYYVNEWKGNSEAQTISVLAYDEMSLFIGKELPALPIQKDVPLNIFVAQLMEAVGIPTYKIQVDSTLGSTILPYTFTQQSGFRDTMQSLAEAFLFFFFVDRKGNFVVQGLPKGLSRTADTWDADFIISDTLEYDMLRTYSGVTTAYNIYEESHPLELAKVSKITLPPGDTKFENIIPKEGPVFFLDYFTFGGSSDVKVSSFTYNAWYLGFTLTNTTTESIEVEISLIGTFLEVETSAKVQNTDTSMVNRMGEKLYEYTNPYLMSRDAAQRANELLLAHMTQQNTVRAYSTRGNPENIPGQQIFNTATVQRTSNVPELVVRQNFSYDGSLSCEANTLCLGGIV